MPADSWPGKTEGHRHLVGGGSIRHECGLHTRDLEDGRLRDRGLREGSVDGRKDS